MYQYACFSPSVILLSMEWKHMLIIVGHLIWNHSSIWSDEQLTSSMFPLFITHPGVTSGSIDFVRSMKNVNDIKPFLIIAIVSRRYLHEGHTVRRYDA